MQARLSPQSDEERQTVAAAGEVDRVYTVQTLARSGEGIFVASGVTGSAALPGVKVVPEGFRVQTVLITRDQGMMRISSTVRD
jgi:fructose-1,6-bisphosphatase/sedoheptulose 1,7-bisphosphatase-like protein